MSQIYRSTSTGPSPPDVPTSFPTDDGTAIPALNILNVNGLDSTENNENGIITRANPDLSNNLQIIITNRIQGVIGTAGAVNADIITFALGATAGVYTFEVRISGAEATTPGGVGYSLFGTIYTTGAAGSIQGTVDRIVNENPALTDASATIVASGNNAIIRVTGAAGFNINWAAVGLYTFVSA